MNRNIRKNNRSRLVSVIAVVLVVFSLLFNVSNIKTNATRTKKTVPRGGDTLKSSFNRIADDCFHVFVDVGANIGVHSRFLMEPQHYPNTWFAHQPFNKYFGSDRDNRDVCAIAIEPNPIHWKRHLELQKAYHAMGWRYIPIQAAVGDDPDATTMTLYHAGDATKEEWGFSVVNHNKTQSKNSETVPMVHLSHFLTEQVRDRRLPLQVYGTNYTKGPQVVMKMDIESTEYFVLPDLIASGALCTTVDFCFGETHTEPRFLPITTRGYDYIMNERSAKAFLKSNLQMLKNAKSCKTLVEFRDDESYLHDGVPFPVPPR